MDYCWVCQTQPSSSKKLVWEGPTTHSLHNAHVLIKEHGLPHRVELVGDDPMKATYRVIATWLEPKLEHTFTGLSWGYNGEGPHGMVTFLEMLEARKFRSITHEIPSGIPFTIRDVTRWPADLRKVFLWDLILKTIVDVPTPADAPLAF